MRLEAKSRDKENKLEASVERDKEEDESGNTCKAKRCDKEKALNQNQV